MEEDNITATAGDQVTLECNVDANPMNLSLVKWYFLNMKDFKPFLVSKKKVSQ